jgi:hypothetical protein
MSGYHIFFIIVGIILICVGIFMSQKQIEELKETTGLGYDPTNFLWRFILYLLIVKLPPIFTRIYFILAGASLIIIVLFLAYY